MTDAEILKFEAPQPHSKQSLRLWLRMLASTRIIEKKIRSHLQANCDSTLPRFDVLAALDRAQAELSMGELSQLMLVSNGNVTGIINRLVEDGLVARRTAPNDSRTFYVSLTPQGHATFNKLAAQHEEIVDNMFVSLSDAEIDQAIHLLNKLNARSGAEETDPFDNS